MRCLNQMREAGVEVVKYHPLRWYDLERFNNRTHRKLLVVDGRVGFTGGLGIADLYLGHAQDRDHWRDAQFRAEGPVVGQMQAAFLDNWIETGGALLDGEEYFPQARFGREPRPHRPCTARPEEGRRIYGSCTFWPLPRPAGAS